MRIPYETKKYIPAPEGVHRAVCVDVEDLGLQTVTYEGNERSVAMVRLVFQLDKLVPETAGSSQPPKRFLVKRRYTQSLHEKASLRKDLESWRGRPFSAEDFKDQSFDLEHLVGKNCRLHIMHRPGTSYNGQPNVYTNIASILPPEDGAALLEADGSYVRAKDWEPNQGNSSYASSGVAAPGTASEDEKADIPF